MPLHIPTFDRSGITVNVVVETPRGSCVRFRYDKLNRVYCIHNLYPLGFVFPFHFGFIPQTRGRDGHPIDVLLLLDDDLPLGCVVKVQLVGVIEGQQTDGRGNTTRNDRIVGISVLAQNAMPVTDIRSLSRALLTEIERFLGDCDAREGKKFTPLGRNGSLAALNLVRSSMLH